MKLPFLPNHSQLARVKFSSRATTLFASIIALFFVAAPYDADAQFTFATDNTGNSAYSDGWQNGDNGGSGFGAWSLSPTRTAGFYTGNPSNISISGMSNPSWALYGNTGGAANAERSLSTAMGVGDTFSFQWGINWDSDGGNKGFSIYSGGTSGAQLINVNNGSNSDITINGTSVGFGYGTAAMTWNFTLTSATNLQVNATNRDGGAAYTGNFTISGNPDSFKFYASEMNSGDNRQPYFNNLTITVVPEPSSLSLLALSGLALLRRRRA
jgi:hypothetical protein